VLHITLMSHCIIYRWSWVAIGFIDQDRDNNVVDTAIEAVYTATGMVIVLEGDLELYKEGVLHAFSTMLLLSRKYAS